MRAGRQKHTLQSVFQELCDKEPDGVPVGSPGQRGCSSRLCPAQLRAEPLEEAQLLRWQPCSRHALCSKVRLLRKNRGREATLCDIAVHIWICSFYLRLKREAGKRVEGPGDLFLVLSQSHRAGAVHQNAAFLQQTHCLQSCQKYLILQAIYIYKSCNQFTN